MIYNENLEKSDTKNQLRDDAIEFALLILNKTENIKGLSVYVNQLLRCSSSIGANIFEAKYAQSRLDFINKLEISLKESSETEYWLTLLHKSGRLSESDYLQLKNTCGSIRRRLIASITTAKSK